MATIEEWTARFVADPADAWRAAKALPKMVGPWDEDRDRCDFSGRVVAGVARVAPDPPCWRGHLPPSVDQARMDREDFPTENEAKQAVDARLRALGWILVDAP